MKWLKPGFQIFLNLNLTEFSAILLRRPCFCSCLTNQQQSVSFISSTRVKIRFDRRTLSSATFPFSNCVRKTPHSKMSCPASEEKAGSWLELTFGWKRIGNCFAQGIREKAFFVYLEVEMRLQKNGINIIIAN